MRTTRWSALGAVLVVATLTGVSSPASAWDTPNQSQARKIWRTVGVQETCGTGQPLQRRGIRIAEARPRGFKWAAVNFGRTRCGNGVLLVKSSVGKKRWTWAGSFGSEFTPALPGSCSTVRDMPARIIPDLTGMTCRGRTTPRALRNDPWF